MNQVEFNRKSWHYRLATVYGQYRETNYWGEPDLSNSNICAYTKAVLWGFALALAFTALAAVGGYMVIDFFSWLFAMYSVGGFIEPQIFALVIVSLLGFGIIIALGVWLTERRPIEKLMGSVSNSFVGNAYEAFKDKVCFEVKFKE